GSAGSTTVDSDFPNAPYPGTWYGQALTNRLAGIDMDPGTPDINATFNSQIDAGCFGPGLVWYYGTDGNEGANSELLPVVLHELGHGLGFQTFTSGSTGNFFSGQPSVWDNFLFDKNTNQHWVLDTPAQRQTVAVGTNQLVWDGAAADAIA